MCVKQSAKGDDNGYIHYTFTNHDNGHADGVLAGGQYNRAPYPKNPANSRSFERGKLMKEQQYNAVGKSVYKKEMTWNRYGSQGEDNVRAVFVQIDYSVNFAYSSLACYLNYVYKFLPAKQVETVYDTNGASPVSKTTAYTYNTQMLLSAEETTTSSGIRKTTYKYPSDFATTEPYKTMVAKHILSPIVEKSLYQDNVFLQKDLTRYKKWNTRYEEEVSTFFAPELIQTQASGQAGPDTRIQYLSYDTYGNPVAVLARRPKGSYS